MHVQGELLVPVLTLFLCTGHQVTAEDEGKYQIVLKPVEDKTEEPPRELRCYRCYEFEEHCQSLANLTNIEINECDSDEIYCMVKRISTRDVLTSFERSCSRECTPGCQTMLSTTKCVTCCSTELCNIDGATRGPVCTLTMTLAAGFLAVILSRM